MSATGDDLETALLERDIARADALAHADAARVVAEVSGRQVDELQRRADYLEARLRAIEESRSWRVMARYQRARALIWRAR